MDLPRLDNSNLLDKTYAILKDRIIRREFKPNQKLSIPELATQLGVSRTPVREALNRLEMDGLVKTVSKVGTFVSAIEIADLIDIIDSRLMLELWVADKLIALSKTELIKKIKRLEKILDQASISVDQLPLESYLNADYNLQFHIEFIRLGDNKKNVEIYLALMNYHSIAAERSLFTKEMVTIGIDQHYAIAEALKRGDCADAKAAIMLHLYDSKEHLIKRLQDNGGEL
jgi:DNA-binding GntR family transcriptional regulator